MSNCEARKPLVTVVWSDRVSNQPRRMNGGDGELAGDATNGAGDGGNERGKRLGLLSFPSVGLGEEGSTSRPFFPSRGVVISQQWSFLEECYDVLELGGCSGELSPCRMQRLTRQCLKLWMRHEPIYEPRAVAAALEENQYAT
ncbi:hypothetical protein PIB30_060073 [Stylosanthes scabra]|uniref:Uncharacterized protein n=1 Tax=Stylosanthes scabra TaxID=79078 RepID=A0ABU6ULA6_9FABA|nr:hypothetical protein [Stylosanthes scabra]